MTDNPSHNMSLIKMKKIYVAGNPRLARYWSVKTRFLKWLNMSSKPTFWILSGRKAQSTSYSMSQYFYFLLKPTNVEN